MAGSPSRRWSVMVCAEVPVEEVDDVVPAELDRPFAAGVAVVRAAHRGTGVDGRIGEELVPLTVLAARDQHQAGVSAGPPDRAIEQHTLLPRHEQVLLAVHDEQWWIAAADVPDRVRGSDPVR